MTLHLTFDKKHARSAIVLVRRTSIDYQGYGTGGAPVFTNDLSQSHELMILYLANEKSLRDMLGRSVANHCVADYFMSRDKKYYPQQA